MEEKFKVLIDYARPFTDLNEDQLYDLFKGLKIEEFKKGDILIEQGQVPKRGYFVLKGMTRKYAIDEDGNDTTYGFYSEKQAIVIFYDHSFDMESPYSVVCMEPCILLISELEEEEASYDETPEFREMTRLMMADNMDKIQEELTAYISHTPEQRVKKIMDTRPELLTRVPQHQLASYLGIKPESLSRIKRRLEGK